MKIGIIGLGYVGLPLAVLFSKKYEVIGYDIDRARIHQLQEYIDEKNEITTERLEKSKILFTNNLNELKSCNIYIITVPTPIDKYNKPDITLLKNASKIVSGLLKKDDIIIYESTVYPGATEEDCIPILEQNSGLIFNKDFFVGYSPERINVGDKNHPIEKIKKIVSGSTKEIAYKINELYSSVLENGTYIASSIKVAEASKVIENCQRDVNIAFMNEMKIILDTLDINSREVFRAAKTRWNWADFYPGLVGGHCISVDPYYLISKAEEKNLHTSIFPLARKINNEMSIYVVEYVIKEIIIKKLNMNELNVLILGITFKPDCNDLRNSKVVDVYNQLKTYNINDIDVYDDIANPAEVKSMYNINIIKNIKQEKNYSVIIKLVNHTSFSSFDYKAFLKKDGIYYEL